MSEIIHWRLSQDSKLARLWQLFLAMFSVYIENMDSKKADRNIWNDMPFGLEKEKDIDKEPVVVRETSDINEISDILYWDN